MLQNQDPNRDDAPARPYKPSTGSGVFVDTSSKTKKIALAVAAAVIAFAVYSVYFM